jgi:hypothetical protein
MSVLNTAIEELQWLPYGKRTKKRRSEIESSGGSEMQGLLHESTKAMVNLGGQINRLNAVTPVLSSLSARMTTIELLLKRIADLLEARKQEDEADRNRYMRHEK